MPRPLATGALTLVFLSAGATPALASHGGDHRPRPSSPICARGLEMTGVERSDNATTPATGRQNQSHSFGVDPRDTSTCSN